MKTLDLEIKNKDGLHVRPSVQFVKLANTFNSDIEVSLGLNKVDGKSILGLMLLAAGKGRKLQITAKGSDANEALVALQQLVEVEKFGEL